MRLIPAIDILNGRCVRLSKGDYNTPKVYSKDPLSIAKSYQDHGIQYLHLVDLDGARSQHIVNHKVLEQICSQTNLQVDFGGGIKSDEDLHIAFECGAQQITGGSIAVKNPETFHRWIKRFGGKKIILGADYSNRKIVTTGWMETSTIDVIEFILHYEREGIRDVICTDVTKDGMLQGVSMEMYKEILTQTGVNLIASGGVADMEDLKRLKDIGCTGVIIGKAIYEGKITLKQLQELC